ncbi:hypothetical protein DYB34_005175, partial [Aphanomyces astaci]
KKYPVRRFLPYPPTPPNGTMPIKDKAKAAAYKKEFNKKWYEKNKEKRMAQIKERKQKNKERELAYSRKNYELHHDKILERKKEYRERNKETLAAKLKIYRNRPEAKEARRAKDKEYRLRQKAAKAAAGDGKGDAVPTTTRPTATKKSKRAVDPRQDVAMSLVALHDLPTSSDVKHAHGVEFVVI